MRSLLGTIVFLLVFTLIVGGGHYYLWARLIRDPGVSAPWNMVATGLLVVLGLSIPAFFLVRSMPRSVTGPYSYIAFGWMGTAFLLITVVFAADLVRWAAAAGAAILALVSGRGAAPVDPARRELIARGIAGAAVVVGGGLAATALRGGLGEVELKEVAVKLPRLPRELSGLTLVQLTDVHVGPTIGKRFIQQIVDKANAQKPDAVFITGDLVDGSVEELARHVEPLAGLKARYGVFFVTGNHEYYSGADDWTAHLPKLGIQVLRNRRVKLGDDASIDLAGVDDWRANYDLDRALEGHDPDRGLVLLAHQPGGFAHAADRGVGLQLSGHTHGGQIWPFTGLVSLVYDHAAGLAQQGESSIYVSRGTGYWGPPMRLGAPAEVTKIVLG